MWARYFVSHFSILFGRSNEMKCILPNHNHNVNAIQRICTPIIFTIDHEWLWGVLIFVHPSSSILLSIAVFWQFSHVDHFKWSKMKWNESMKKGKKPATGTRCAQTTDAYTKICKKTEETTWDGKSFYADAFNTFSKRKIFTDNFLLSCRSRAYISKNWFFFFFSILPLMLIQ